ncbi:MAG: hypothetical protein ABFD52_09335 [Acidobacteriota bacterium]
MEQHYELIIKVNGEGTPEKAAELSTKVIEQIKAAGEMSLGNLQASTTLIKK